ncbi:MAG: hypothetical protein PVG99_15715 [Desulfobacteraceae bacterium]|jgi:uncharacterized membrane protein HdeD (DUF308 family)
MIDREPLPLKNLSLFFAFLCCALFTAYVIFVGGVSIWVGLSHPQQDGFWMPILAGTLLIIAVFWLFLRLSKFIVTAMKQTDRLHI